MIGEYQQIQTYKELDEDIKFKCCEWFTVAKGESTTGQWTYIRRPQRGEAVSYTRWNETHSAKRFSALLKVMETRWKETSGKKVKANVIVEMERKHVRIIQPEATDDSKNTTYGTFLEPLRSYRMTVTEGDGRVKPVSWINVWSRPHSAVCSHTLHNPCESCHCKCTLNEPPSIPRLAKVRCD